MVRQIDSTTRRKIARALVEGVGKGESVDQLAKRIGPVISNRRRARTIARTEVGKASQMGQLESFAQSNVVERKQWNTSQDEFVRDSHVAADGQVVDLEEQFQLGSGARASFPLDPSLPAGDLVNCRCFVTPVFVEETGDEE
jgi:SPP1 gp7 family putative phage head morphogenesis protein